MDYENSPSSSELPSYSPSSPSPSYTCQLGSGERLLEHTPQSHSSQNPTSLFIKKAGRSTVILNGQEDGATMPAYGRQAIISGNLLLEQSESIIEVVLKVKAKLDTTISEAGGTSIRLVDDSYTLWSQSLSSSTGQKTTCPDQVHFSARLPITFQHSGKTYPLPPSYSASYFAIPSLIVRSSYTLHFIITRIRHRKLDLWPKTKQILIPFSYCPKTRANRPIIPSPCFFSSVKTSPEEWHQAISPLKTRPNAKMDPLYCHLFVPAGRIYGLADTIPFHVQLSGNICALQDLCCGAELGRVMSVDSDTTVVSNSSKRAQTSPPLLRVSLLRQVSVSMRSVNSWKNTAMGQATLWPIPPDLGSCCSSTAQCREGHVDWEGEVQCNKDITVGAFEAGNVNVKDFITLVLTPPQPYKSPWLQLQVTIPIRLVTDSFAEVTGLEVGLAQS
ncbi:hypothetical protein CPB84DRAFT_1766171 [Gymnopilus junonius]|uniref:Uncharacterized protein n=1 Tax=Gymnopilus junonius TaxID=109634 RepID=A0A9P5NYA3_GYMJU|nr:hypothetical protein CPB84DRAFT_1766171 [Gymnopilus junonius]